MDRAEFRDRIVELRRMPAGELRANKRNWRLHPESQRGAMEAMLADVGFVGALVAREVDDGVELLDGHLRSDIAAGSVVPVLIVDVTDEEADKILATYDPLSSLALIDDAALSGLLANVKLDDNADLRQMIADMHDGIALEAESDKASQREVEGMALQPHEHYDFLVVLATSSQEWNVLCERLGLKPEPRRGGMGTSRAIRAAKLLSLLAKE